MDYHSGEAINNSDFTVQKMIKKCGFNQQKMTFIAFFGRANLRETSHSAPLQGLIFPHSMLENSGGSTYKGYSGYRFSL
jgi:hypothetical protein